MPSNIDPTKPVTGNATTQSVRDNFGAAKTEIEDLQSNKAQRAGDLSGTAASTTVSRIQGRTVSTAAPSTTSDALMWTGSQWAPSSIINDTTTSTTRTFSSERINNLITSPSVSGITGLRSEWVPMIHRLPITPNTNPFGGNHYVTGVAFDDYNWEPLFITTEANVLWRGSEEAAYSPYIDPSWYEKIDLPINFATEGYRGCFNYHFYVASPMAQGSGSVLFTNGTQALWYRYHHPNWNREISVITLNGLPTGFGVTAMWAACRTCYVICNNTLYRATIPYAAQFTGNLTFSIVNIPAAAEITTMTRLFAYPDASWDEDHYLLVWGTSPSNRVAFYNSSNNSWTALTAPFTHSGGANAFVVFTDGRVGAYKATSPSAYHTCEALTAPTQWTQRFVGSPVTFPTNRRLRIIEGRLCFLPSSTGSSGSCAAEGYRDTDLDQEVYWGPSTAAGASRRDTFAFPTEYLCHSQDDNPGNGIIPSTSNTWGTYAVTWGQRQTRMSILADMQTFQAYTQYSFNSGEREAWMPWQPSAVMPLTKLGPTNRRFLNQFRAYVNQTEINNPRVWVTLSTQLP